MNKLTSLERAIIATIDSGQLDAYRISDLPSVVPSDEDPREIMDAASLLIVDGYLLLMPNMLLRTTRKAWNESSVSPWV